MCDYHYQIKDLFLSPSISFSLDFPTFSIHGRGSIFLPRLSHIYHHLNRACVSRSNNMEEVYNWPGME